MEAETPAAMMGQYSQNPPHCCDLCGSSESEPLPEATQFGSGGVDVCSGCGFVFVPQRRSSEEIAASWGQIFGEGYSSSWAAVEARLRYVASHYAQGSRNRWQNKHVLEIGAGEGRFLDIAREYGATHCAGIEPFKGNCDRIRKAGHTVFEGTAEQAPLGYYFDVVCILWTAENAQDCLNLFQIARRYLCQGGSLIVGTGSRILVPFKKPISTYFSNNAADTHCFRFSAKSLSRALQKSGFNHITLNDYQQCDWLVAEARIDKNAELVYAGTDDPQEVLEYFRNWAKLFP